MAERRLDWQHTQPGEPLLDARERQCVDYRDDQLLHARYRCVAYVVRTGLQEYIVPSQQADRGVEQEGHDGERE